MHRVFAPIALVLLALAGCAASPDDACRIGADCPSGACGANGLCVPADDDDGTGAGAGGGMTTTSSGGAGGESSAVGGGGQGGGGLCPANQDGVIEADELFLAPGLSANLRVAQDTTVDTMGSTQPDGSRIWDLTVALPGDHASVVETLALDGLWYADEFPTATYAARLSDGNELLGVYQVTANKLLLLGVVSPGEGFSRTELSFDPPVVVLDLPLSLGKSWATDTTVTGVAQGINVFYFEDYAFEVDAHGVTKTPLGDFDTLRVHTELVRTVGALVTTIQSHAFMAECFGTVGAITSEDHELEVEFTAASEIRRLAP